MSSLPSYELLGKFYLGRNYDLTARQLSETNLLYDSKDLVTHALCVGMTGSGKTGLCLSLLEEAAIDGIPAICIDPKGDLGNLLLTFPELSPSDFRPWVDPGEASRKNISIDQLAEESANAWKAGLAKWDQDGERIQRFRDAVDVNIYTPGSTIGLPLTVLKSFDVPPQSTLDDPETLRERVSSSASGLLTLLGLEADPLTSREHILLSMIFDHAWKNKQNLDLGELIREIQTPPIDRVGVIDLETFMSTSDRIKLAMNLNNLLAAPSFAGWLEGEPLSIKNLLYSADGKPRLSIISIAHLNDAERMFFVTIFLGELLSWMRAQPGTGSLRALFYMDEVYGYFPPTAKPPSKPPMLTLLKQARAFGLGIVLATQNPVDLDYKGLSNMGTWFLGRLQTQRDKDRVLDGLEGAAAQSGKGFNRAEMERTLSALGSRVFLLNNVHEDNPEIFQSRWALSFLRGPLSREHIQSLMSGKRSAAAATATKFAGSLSSGDKKSGASARPIVPADIDEKFLQYSKSPRSGAKLIYRPAILGQAAMHFVRATNNIDYWDDTSLMVAIADGVPDPFWSSATTIPAGVLELGSSPESDFLFANLPSAFSSAKNFKDWDKDLKEYLFRNHQVTIYNSKALKRNSLPSQLEADARIELSQAAREARDLAVKKLKEKTEEKLKSLQAKIAAAEQKIQKEKADEKSQWMNSILNVATSVLGAVLGNKIATKTNMTQMTSAAKKIGQATGARGDVARAEEALQEILEMKLQMEIDCQADVDKITEEFSAENLALETIEVPARKTDTRVKLLALVWVPWQIDSNGIATPLVELPEASRSLYHSNDRLDDLSAVGKSAGTSV